MTSNAVLGSSVASDTNDISQEYIGSDPTPVWWDLMVRFELAVGHGNVIIAGGAVRDFLLCKEAKDIDVFITAEVDSRANTPEKMVQFCLGNDAKITRVNERGYNPFFQRCVDEALQMTITVEWRGHNIQVVVLAMRANPLCVFEVLSRVDFGICAAAYARVQRGSEYPPQIVVTPGFEKDFKNKTFTLYRADNEDQEAYSRKRFARITKDRYPDWTFVDGR